MALTVSENTGAGGKDFDPVPAAVHDAVCYLIVDLGTHYDANYDKDKHEVAVGWEIPALRLEFEKDGVKSDVPRAVSKRYTLNLGERANLRKDLEAWRGRPFNAEELSGFDLRNVLGASCMLQVMHKQGSGKNAGKTYANVSNIMPAREKLTGENPVQWYSMEEGGEIPKNIPDWLRKQIDASNEMKGGLESKPQDLWPTIEACIIASSLKDKFDGGQVSQEQATEMYEWAGGNATKFVMALSTALNAGVEEDDGFDPLPF